MPIPPRHQLPTGKANLQWLITDDSSRTLMQTQLGETFHSGCGAISECLVVYLLHAGVAERLRDGRATSVLEYGLGTATAFLLTAALAEFYETPLHYRALENMLLGPELVAELDLPNCLANCLRLGGGDVRQVRRAGRGRPHVELSDGVEAGGQFRFEQSQFAALPDLWQRFQACLPRLEYYAVELESPMGGLRCFRIALGAYVMLELTLGDAALFRGGPMPCHDAVYFDPFSPDSNPEMWTPEVLQRAVETLRPTGRLTSYCVKSSVRRCLTDLGLTVDKVPGPLGGKREVLLATRQAL